MKVRSVVLRIVIFVIIAFAIIIFAVLLSGCQAEKAGQTEAPQTKEASPRPKEAPQEIKIKKEEIKYEARRKEPCKAFSSGSVQNNPGESLGVLNCEIENKFPKGLRLIVDLEHDFPLDFAASDLKAKIGEGFINVAPENDPENPTPGKMVFEIGNSNYFHTWTEMDSGTVRIKDKKGNEVIFETGPFVYSDPRFKWKEEESKNMRVLFYGSARRARPEKVLLEAERILGNFSFTPPRKIRIIAYNSKRAIDPALPFRSKATREDLITMGMAFDDINAVFVLNGEEFLNTVRHELMHLIFDHLTEKAFAILPTWLNEGLAMYAGSENLSERHIKVISTAIENGEFLSLRELSSFSGKPDMVELNYAEAHSFIRFLIKEYGQDTMLEFLRFINENFGVELGEAVEEVYGKPQDFLEKEWIDSLTTGSR